MRFLSISILLILSGCSTFASMTPTQKAWTVAGVLVTGALTAQELANGNHRRAFVPLNDVHVNDPKWAP